MSFNLNWREIDALCRALAPSLEGQFVDRVIVPERPQFPEGFLKGEWVIRLSSRSRTSALLMSLRSKRPYFTLLSGKGPRASEQATHAAFDLSLHKHLGGLRIETIEALPRDRVAVLWFEPVGDRGRHGLVLFLAPAHPEAILIEASSAPRAEFFAEDGAPGPSPRFRVPYPVLARSKNSKLVQGEYAFPTNSKAPPAEVRPEILGTYEKPNLDVYARAIREATDQEAFESRAFRLETLLRQELKQAETRAEQNQVTLSEALREADWQKFGDLLKASMGLQPALTEKNTRTVTDWETGEAIEIKCDPKLDLRGQVVKFYSHAKRKHRRIEEARIRLETFQSRAENLRSAARKLIKLRLTRDLEALGELETEQGLHPEQKARAEARASFGWSGKTFFSQEGLPILVGRAKDENLELTFKFARGNDLWLHVRGKPGSHVVIPLRSKKSASLETLLDAAQLCLFYSGGADWGKTEIDYTHKKYVKRIRDSSEASYTENKTLIVQVDRTRIDRLMAGEK